MRRTCLLLALLTVAAAPAGAVTQAKPDFSGSWVFDAEHSSKTQNSYGFRSEGGGTVQTKTEVPLTPVLGNEFTAKQDAKTLTIERTMTPTSVEVVLNGVKQEAKRGDPVTFSEVYALDGSETRYKLPSSRIGRLPFETVATAAWDGDKLVVQLSGATAAPGAAKTQRVFHLGADGILLVDRISPAPNGVTPNGAAIVNQHAGDPPDKTTTAYKKAR